MSEHSRKKSRKLCITGCPCEKVTSLHFWPSMWQAFFISGSWYGESTSLHYWPSVRGFFSLYIWPSVLKLNQSALLVFSVRSPQSTFLVLCVGKLPVWQLPHTEDQECGNISHVLSPSCPRNVSMFLMRSPPHAPSNDASPISMHIFQSAGAVPLKIWTGGMHSNGIHPPEIWPQWSTESYKYEIPFCSFICNGVIN